MLLKAIKVAIGWEDETNVFMPYYASTTTTTTRRGSDSENNRDNEKDTSKKLSVVEEKRKKTLAALNRLRSALEQNLHSTTTANNKYPPLLTPRSNDNNDNDNNNNNNTKNVEINSSTLNTNTNAFDYCEETGTKSRPRPLSAREQLLRKRGTSLASACQLLDQSMERHYNTYNAHYNHHYHYHNE